MILWSRCEPSLTSNSLREPEYKAAPLEVDRAKLPERVTAAEAAIR
jgi:hypothetical protein